MDQRRSPFAAHIEQPRSVVHRRPRHRLSRRGTPPRSRRSRRVALDHSCLRGLAARVRERRCDQARHRACGGDTMIHALAPWKDLIRAAFFIVFLILGFRARRSQRAALTFIAYTIAASLLIGFTQLEAWPFS